MMMVVMMMMLLMTMAMLTIIIIIIRPKIAWAYLCYWSGQIRLSPNDTANSGSTNQLDAELMDSIRRCSSWHQGYHSVCKTEPIC